MYDYESQPQDVPYLVGLSLGARHCHLSFLECDGAILVSSEAIEHEGIQAWREWFAETNRQIFVFYPPEPPNPKAEVVSTPGPEITEDADTHSDKITKFLGWALSVHGEQSVVYISFGTLFWPAQPERVWALFDVLIELGIPFIFAHPSQLTIIPNDVTQRLKDSGLGITSKWAPQQPILLHPATGWYVTHAGQNSRMESLTAGVPMICWPIHSDQPFNAAQLSVNLNVAYELLEVRSGPNGYLPMRRFFDSQASGTGRERNQPVSGSEGHLQLTGTLDAVKHEFREVLEKARGEDGKVKRRNALKIREQMRTGWIEGERERGYAVREMRRFIEHVRL